MSILTTATTEQMGYGMISFFVCPPMNEIAKKTLEGALRASFIITIKVMFQHYGNSTNYEVICDIKLGAKYLLTLTS